MMAKFSVQGQKIGPLFERSSGIERVRKAAQDAIADASKDFVSQAAQDVAGAGRFGKRWTDGFKVETEDDTTVISHQVPYFRVFTKTTTIHGRPLLWIPLPFAKDAQGVRARDYPGRLFRVDRKGGKAPLLMAPGSPAQAKYFGKSQVVIPQKFRTFEIARDVFSHLADYIKGRLG